MLPFKGHNLAERPRCSPPYGLEQLRHIHGSALALPATYIWPGAHAPPADQGLDPCAEGAERDELDRVVVRSAR
jgi:hypothetical protein